MRTIKFRGKSRKTGEWLVGDLLQVANEVFIAPSDGDWFDFIPWSKNNVFHLPSTTYQVIPDTVGQFTGLLDKNGKEIYEGDIVKQTWGSPHYVKGVLYDCFGRIGDIRYECDLIGIHTKNGMYRIVNSDLSNTVIGNIHDNPELLKQ